MIINNLFTNSSNYEVVTEPEYTLKAETETVTKPGLVMGIETLLNIISIASQDRRERNQKGLNKQNVSVIPPFIKGKKP